MHHQPGTNVSNLDKVLSIIDNDNHSEKDVSPALLFPDTTPKELDGSKCQHEKKNSRNEISVSDNQKVDVVTFRAPVEEPI